MTPERTAARNQDDVEVFDFNTGRTGWQKEYDESGIRARWRGPVFIARSPGWFGVRWRRRPYYVLRDSRRHKPLFSEREGHPAIPSPRAGWPLATRGEAVSAEHPAATNYDGPDESAECAYPGCTNRLRRASFTDEPQFCSKEHRDGRSAATCDCGHPQGWHRKGVGSCIECACSYFDDRDEAAVDRVCRYRA